MTTDGTLGLQWVRLDTAWPRNPKTLELVQAKQWRTLIVYVSSLAYAGENATDGWIPSFALPFIHGTPTDARRLTDVRLWLTLPDCDGWHINDWSLYQPSRDEMAARSKHAREAAMARWHGKKNGSK